MASLATSNLNGVSDDVSATPAKWRLWGYWVVLSAAILPYLGSLRFGFTYDDNVQVLDLPAIRSWHFVPRYFLEPMPGVVVRYYRPIFFLWFRLNYFLWNTHSWGWHFTNVLLHALASVLVFALLRKYFKDQGCATVGALVFAVHPAHIETVAWVSGCTDSLMAISLLSSVLLWMKNCEAPTLVRRIGSLLCCTAALLSKETAIILPVLVWLHALVGIPATNQEHGTTGKRLRFAFREAAPFACLTAAYLVVRSVVLTGIPGTPNWVSHTQSLLTVPSLFLFYVRHVFVPVKLSIFYDFPTVDRPSSHLFWLPLLVLAATAAAAWLWFRNSRDRRVVIAGIWITFPVAPVLYIRMFQPDDFLHDRYLYLSVVGLSLLAGILYEWLWKRESESMKATFPFPAVILGFVSLCLALATAVQAEQWKDNLSLYTHAVQVAPKNTMGRNNLAGEYAVRGRYREASTMLEGVLQDRPRMWLAIYNYGFVNYHLGSLTTAEDYLHRAIAIDPGDPEEHLYLGATYSKEGRLTEAAEQLRHGIALRPDGNGYHFTLGMIEFQRGNKDVAKAEIQMELKYHPENARQVAQASALFE